ncbi:hypothetical protein KV564_06370 [Paenibacillus chitinolyticus]|nr:hypothetical protein [Paenibacillus chitinolyticus]
MSVFLLLATERHYKAHPFSAGVSFLDREKITVIMSSLKENKQLYHVLV